ncbi:MAG TPA: ribosome maturation factor RimM [Micromonosporaceae bacterium]|nr:ribosome maturation factor RimM [Micromonosporaceae bacterium]
MKLIVGQILRPHGIRGELLVDLRTDEPAARFAVGSVLATDSTAVRRRVEPVGAAALGVRWTVPETLTVESVRPHLGRLIVVFEGVYDRNVAEELRGVLLCVDSADVPPTTDPDEFNDHELVGLAAVTPDGEKLGEVQRIEHAPAADLLVLRLTDGRSALVPFVRAIVPEVDVAGGRVVLTPPGGLFDL